MMPAQQAIVEPGARINGYGYLVEVGWAFVWLCEDFVPVRTRFSA
jgi:hypothetical protein